MELTFAQKLISLPHTECGKHFTLEKNAIYYVVSGGVDVFMTEVYQNKEHAALGRFYQVSENDILLGGDVALKKKSFQMVACCHIQTKVIQLSSKDYFALFDDPAFKHLLGLQINQFFLKVNKAIEHEDIAVDTLVPKPNEQLSLQPDQYLFTTRPLLWVKVLQGNLHFFKQAESKIPPGQIIALSYGVWLTCSETSQIEALLTPTPEEYRQIIDCFYQVIINYAAYQYDMNQQEEKKRIEGLAQENIELINKSAKSFQNIFEHKTIYEIPESKSALFNAICFIGCRFNLTLTMPNDLEQEKSIYDKIEKITLMSELQFRQVRLQHHWSKHFYGTLLVFNQKNHQPRVIYSQKNQLKIYNPLLMTSEPLTKKHLENIDLNAYYFYKPFAEQDLKLKKLVFYGLSQAKTELFRLFLLGSMGGLLAMTLPIATGILFDHVIPSANLLGLCQVVLAIVASAVAIGIFELIRNFALLRITGKSELIVESAIWDRLLKLPLPFFRQYSPGDLANRASSFSYTIDIVSGQTVEIFLSAIFSIYSFLVLFYFSPTLAIIVALLTLFLIIITLLICYCKYLIDREAMDYNGKIIGSLFAFINGIVKVKVTGSETRMYAYWAQHYAMLRKKIYNSQLLTNVVETLADSFITIMLIIIFAVTYLLSLDKNLSPGEFLAFYAAFNISSLATVQLTRVLINSVIAIPILNRVQPIIKAQPEVDATKSNPGRLTGRIELDHISFRYSNDGPLTLKNVSLEVSPGQFVAIVGPSGSGKSTLLRLLLGFEKAQNGMIYYDNQDIAGLNITLLRRQIGVVLQHSTLLPTHILHNIIGESHLPIEKAWDAVRLAGLEEDIKAMPMGMFTHVGEDGGGLSGGQIQRLLIARAIVRKPNILFFDEATSALDNETQLVVSNSLTQLKATRIVIAHRLSTIKQADRIFVIDQGSLVEQGDYAMLMHGNGIFKQLVDRQIL